MDFSHLTGSLGRVLVVFGLLLSGIGLLLLLAPKIPWLGRLPGDIIIRRENFTFYFPLATCLLVSAVLSLVFWILRGK
ncbi:MAG: DUF2905 domain-containing protein [Candidatus Glassbacteria bacterium]|nr:DUF2905 domain-containing protein [Candidatus Glassbacteria bacterium]